MAGYSNLRGPRFEGPPFPNLLNRVNHTVLACSALHIFLIKLTRARVCLTFIFLLLQCNNQGGSCDVGCQEGRQGAKKAKVATKAAKRPRKPQSWQRQLRAKKAKTAGAIEGRLRAMLWVRKNCYRDLFLQSPFVVVRE